ncbi:MAG: glutamate--tRNA ligase [Armatimonadaceae bacterium]
MTQAVNAGESADARPVRTRFAPSPTGFLHVGAFRTALFSWLLAKKYGGQFILRVEDTDQNRLVPGALENIIRSMIALGIPYDEGPDRATVAALDAAQYGTVPPEILPENGGAYGPYFQSQRLDIYDAVVERLLNEGKAYYAFETEEELEGARAAAAARKLPYRYSRKFRDYPLEQARERVAGGEPAVVRFKMPVAGPIVTRDYLRGETVWDADTQDDFVIRKMDGFPPYHLAAVVDDYEMKVSHVLRGEEWIPSFPKHVCLYEALGWEQPVWIHTPNVLGPDKKKLSKRHGAKPIYGPVPEYKDGKPTGDMLEGLVNQEGYLPEALVNFLSLIGWSPKDDTEIMAINEIVARFDIDSIALSAGVFDQEKLQWMNGVYIRQLSPDDLVSRAVPFLMEAKLISEQPDAEQRAYIAEVVALEQEKYRRLDEVPEFTAFFFTELPRYNDDSVRKWLQKDGEAMAGFLLALASALEAAEPWNLETVEGKTREVGASYGLERGKLTHPVRVATSGRETGPGLFELMTVLGRERTVRRLRHAAELARA